MSKRRNPVAGIHPDLFEEKGTPMVVPMADLSRAELLKIPIKNYSAEEIAELHETDDKLLGSIINKRPVAISDFSEEQWEALEAADWTDNITERDSGAASRIDNFVDTLKTRVGHLEDPDEDYVMEMAGDSLDYDISDSDWERIHDVDGVDELMEQWIADGFSEDQVENAITDAFHDINNYNLEVDTNADPYYSYGSSLIRTLVTDSFWMDSHDVEALVEGMSDKEIEIAVGKINEEQDAVSFETGMFEKSFAAWKKPGVWEYWEIQIDEAAHYAVDANPNMEKIASDVEENLTGVAPEGSLSEEAGDMDESRILYRFDDGSFIYNVLAEEMPWEGKKLRHCVGNKGMGYIQKVKAGKNEIYSLRTAQNKPVLTIQYDLQDKAIHQIKGKANRLPGYAAMRIEGAEVIKPDEVKKIVEFIQSIGLDPWTDLTVKDYAPYPIPDLHPALVETMGEPWAPPAATLPAVDARAKAISFMSGNKRRRNPAAPSCPTHLGEACGSGFCIPA